MTKLFKQRSFITIVISVIFIIVYPQYINSIEKIRACKAQEEIEALRISMDRFWYKEYAMSAVYNPTDLKQLDINNPNDTNTRLYNYSLVDNSTVLKKNYEILAERIGGEDKYWIKWIQSDNNKGRFYKSRALGGE